MLAGLFIVHLRVNFLVNIMRKLFITSCLIFVALSCLAQIKNDTTGIYRFNIGRVFYENGQKDSALAVWSKIVDGKIGQHYDIYGDALFNIPNLYWEMKKYEKAKEGYKKVLASDLRDDVETGSLMEPHANYKHKAAVALAGLCQRDSNYTEALSWLDKAQTLYPYWGFEGSATNISQEESYLLAWKTDLLISLDRRNEAVRQIILDLIYAEYPESFFRNAEDKLVELVDKKSFVNSFGTAIERMIIKKEKGNLVASFKFKKAVYEILVSKSYPPRNLPHFFHVLFIPKSQEISRQYIVSYIKRQHFYARLSK